MSIRWFTLLLMLLGLAGACGETTRPEITPALIEKSLTGRTIEQAKFLKTWRFDPAEPRQLTIVQQKVSGDQGRVLIDLKTQELSSSPDGCSGQVWLEYEWLVDQWVLTRIVSISFECT